MRGGNLRPLEGLKSSLVEVDDLSCVKLHVCEFWNNSLGRYQAKLTLCHLLDDTATGPEINF